MRYFLSSIFVGLVLWVLTDITQTIHAFPNGFGAIIAINSIVIGLLLSIRETQSNLQKQFAFDKNFYRDRWLIKPLGNIIEFYTNIVRKFQNNPQNDFNETAYKLARRYIDECIENLVSLDKGQWTIDDTAQRMELLINVVNDAKVKINATSDVDFVTWWQSPHGQRYLQSNINATQQRKVIVQRIFIVKRSIVDGLEQMNASEQLFRNIKVQEESGVQIGIAIEEDVARELRPFPIENLIICDDNFTAWSLTNASDGGKASVNRDDIIDAQKRFSKIEMLSKKPSEFEFYKKYSSANI